MMLVDGFEGDKVLMFSMGKGCMICFFFMFGDFIIFYVSIYLGGDECLEMQCFVNGVYIWFIFEDFDIFVFDFEGNIVK